jgi:glycosyltransferase involved in cell wall biosynthesis
VIAEEDFLQWHIITGEYPPQLGGVSDYTYQVAQEMARTGIKAHVWAPATHLQMLHQDSAQVHALPKGFGWRWLKELDWRLKFHDAPRNILIQYVPHMYGWKSMNLALCWWIFRQRKHNVCVMFHEVAFPFRSGQPLRHRLLAMVHRIMAWSVLRSVRHSFTSTDQHLALLQKLGNQQTPISMLRICSNIPWESYQVGGARARTEDAPNEPFTIGIFSNFDAEIRSVLEPVIGRALENPDMRVALLGPGEAFRQSLGKQYPQAADRIESTGRLHVTEVARHMQRCDALLQLYPDGAVAARGTLIAALASGVPVITTSGPRTDRLLLESQTMLFAEASPQSVKEALEVLKKSPELAREMGAKAQRLYKESFHPAVIVSAVRNTGSCPIDKDLARNRLSVGDASGRENSLKSEALIRR